MKFQTEPATAGFAGVGFGPAGKRKLEIRQVWAHNVEQEFALIRYAAEYFPYVSMDTEFPGVVHNPNPSKHHVDLTPSENYAAVKANVDALHLIQVGLAFAASPSSPPAFAFQINLREFDPRVHPHAPDSITLLRDHGIDFAAHRSHGVDARVLAALLMSSGLVCAGGAVTWVAFSAGYDFGYLVKLLMGRKLPKTLPEFLGSCASSSATRCTAGSTSVRRRSACRARPAWRTRRAPTARSHGASSAASARYTSLRSPCGDPPVWSTASSPTSTSSPNPATAATRGATTSSLLLLLPTGTATSPPATIRSPATAAMATATATAGGPGAAARSPRWPWRR